MAKKAKYSVGDKVMLNVGGPDMAVMNVHIEGGQGDYTCQWFAGKKLSSGFFKEDSLIQVIDNDTK